MDTNYKIVLAFVTLLVGIALVGTIAENILAKTTPTTVSSETISIASLRTDADVAKPLNTSNTVSIANPPTGWKIEDCPITGFTLKNQSGATLTETTDYVFTATSGTFTVKNVAALNRSASNTTTASYTYCGDGYLNSNFGRTSTNLIPGFFAIALLAVSLGLFYSVAKDMKII